MSLSDAEVAQIRGLVVEQVSAYHRSLIERNKAATAGEQSWVAENASLLKHKLWLQEHNQRVFADQRFFGALVFWTVIAIVGLSLALTVYQFVKDRTLTEKALVRLLAQAIAGTSQAQVQKPSDQDVVQDRPTPATGGASNQRAPEPRLSPEALTALLSSLRPTHSLSLGPSGLQLGSQLVGLSVLAFSLGFFYLYLEKVYPITVTQTVGAPAEQTKPATVPSSQSR